MAPLAEYTHPSKNDSLVPDLAEALQYSATYGTKHFNTWWKEHIERIHNPPYAHWEVLCTAANTDGMDAVMRTFFDRGDYMLVEEFGEDEIGFADCSVPWPSQSGYVPWVQANWRAHGCGWDRPSSTGPHHGGLERGVPPQDVDSRTVSAPSGRLMSEPARIPLE